MNTFIRPALVFIVLIFILGIEQALGLPVIFLTMVLFLGQILEFNQAVVFNMIMGLILAVFYQFWLGVGVLLMMGGLMIMLLESRNSRFQNLRYLGIILVLALSVSIIIGYQWSWLKLAYHLVVWVGIFLSLLRQKRHRTALKFSKFI